MRSRPVLLVPSLAVALALTAAACTSIDEFDLGERTFAPDACDPIVPTPPPGGYELVDGEVRHGTPADPDFYAVSLRPDIAYGDLTGDSVDEAAVVLDCSRGNRPMPVGRVLAVGPGGPEPLAAVPTPAVPDGANRMELGSLAIVDQRLEARWVVLEAGDAPCCPTGSMVVAYRWDGTDLVLVGTA